jgi:hypothetical protein
VQACGLQALALFVALCLACAVAPAPVAVERQRGVSWVAGPHAVDPRQLDRLVEDHVDWISQTPFGWQERHDAPGLHLGGSHVMWGESDLGLEVTTRLAHERSIRVLLKPQIWLTRPQSGRWLGDLAMRSAADWQRWFDEYREFILHYARLAERTGIDALCVGAELRATVVGHEAEWRRIIADVRRVFRGRLTYAANWDGEFEELPFWDALDWIGIQAYFPLASVEGPTLEELLAAWRPHREVIARVQRRWGKPIVFTEIGYRSVPGAATRPWEWDPHGSSREPASTDGLALQARCYEAFFRAFWDESWFGGAYVWKWYPALPGEAVERSRGFTPQGKPAESVIARWYGRPKD